MTDIDRERVRVRELLLEAGNDALFDAVMACEQRGVPRREIAGFISGSEAGVEEVLAGRREAIAQKVRGIAREKPAANKLAKHLGKYEHGFTPCAFHVKLAGGMADLSIVALRLDPVN